MNERPTIFRESETPRPFTQEEIRLAAISVEVASLDDASLVQESSRSVDRYAAINEKNEQLEERESHFLAAIVKKLQPMIMQGSSAPEATQESVRRYFAINDGKQQIQSLVRSGEEAWPDLGLILALLEPEELEQARRLAEERELMSKEILDNVDRSGLVDEEVHRRGLVIPDSSQGPRPLDTDFFSKR